MTKDPKEFTARGCSIEMTSRLTALETEMVSVKEHMDHAAGERKETLVIVREVRDNQVAAAAVLKFGGWLVGGGGALTGIGATLHQLFKSNNGGG